MKLKVKIPRFTTGRKIVILHKNFSVKSGIHVDERISLEKNSRKAIAVVDTAVGMLKEDEILVSTEVADELSLKPGDLVEIQQTCKPRSIEFISRKMECKPLSDREIKEIVKDIVDNALTESEIAFFVSAIYKCGMSLREVKDMIDSIVSTGKRLNLHKKLVVDKHSIGGVPGRTTPLVVSICAAAGLIMPKTSSRAITSPAGTADALEVICKVDFSIPEIEKIIRKTGACMVWGGSLGLAPADDKIIQVEKLLNLDPESQLIASIMAKKLSVGSKFILIEIPYGKFVKVNKKQALLLKDKFEKIGKSFNVKVECVLDKTPEPVGNGIGPALEIQDVIRVLKREDSCFMLEDRALFLASKLLELSGKAKKGEGIEIAKRILDSGEAYKKFVQIIKAQKGNVKKISKAKFSKDIFAGNSGRITEIDIKKINHVSKFLGCPIGKFAGIYLFKHMNSRVKKGEKIMTLYSESEHDLDNGANLYKKIKPIKIR